MVAPRAIGNHWRTEHLHGRRRTIYVAVLSGWGGVYPLSTGSAAADSGNLRNVSRILAFKLGGTATLPPIQKTTFVLSPPPEPRNAGRCWICSYAVDRESDALKVKTDRRCQPASLHLAGIVAMDYPRTRGGRNT
jgi:hypothetical protein